MNGWLAKTGMKARLDPSTGRKSGNKNITHSFFSTWQAAVAHVGRALNLSVICLLPRMKAMRAQLWCLSWVSGAQSTQTRTRCSVRVGAGTGQPACAQWPMGTRCARSGPREPGRLLVAPPLTLPGSFQSGLHIPIARRMTLLLEAQIPGPLSLYTHVWMDIPGWRGKKTRGSGRIFVVVIVFNLPWSSWYPSCLKTNSLYII